jgi:hypothetical protein
VDESIGQIDKQTLEEIFEEYKTIYTPKLDELEKALLGKIIKEYPVLNEDYAIRYNLYLTEKEGKHSVVLRWINVLPDLQCKSEFYRFNMENVEKLRDIFGDALKTVDTKILKR